MAPPRFSMACGGVGRRRRDHSPSPDPNQSNSLIMAQINHPFSFRDGRGRWEASSEDEDAVCPALLDRSSYGRRATTRLERDRPLRRGSSSSSEEDAYPSWEERRSCRISRGDNDPDAGMMASWGHPRRGGRSSPPPPIPYDYGPRRRRQVPFLEGPRGASVRYYYPSSSGGSLWWEGRQGTPPAEYRGDGSTRNNRLVFDQSLRPREARVYMEATPAMLEREELLSSTAVVVVDNGQVRTESSSEVKDAIVGALLDVGAHELISVAPTYPHGYLAMCSDRRVRDALLRAGEISTATGKKLCFYPWLAERYADQVSLDFYVTVSLEGLPHHAWNRGVVERIVSDWGIIDCIDPENSLDFRAYRFWAWAKDPADIPSECYLTLVEPPEGGMPEIRVVFERGLVMNGLVYCIRIRIEDVEDLTFLPDPPEA